MNGIRYTVYNSISRETIPVKCCYARLCNSQNSRAFRHTVGAAVARIILHAGRVGRRVMVYFNVISKRCHVGGKLLYRCQPPLLPPTLICITIMVSPLWSVLAEDRPSLYRDCRPLNRDAAISQPQKRLQINVTFLCALI